MNSVIFDSLAVTKDLRAAGFTEPQAEAMVAAHIRVLDEVLGTTLATKTDFNVLDRKFDTLSINVELFVSNIKSDYRLLKWMTGTLMAGMILVLLKIFFPGVYP